MIFVIQEKRRTSVFKVLLHTVLVLATGGLWLIVLVVRALTK